MEVFGINAFVVGDVGYFILRHDGCSSIYPEILLERNRAGVEQLGDGGQVTRSFTPHYAKVC